MSKKINWGIIGLGKIAHKFAQDLMLVDNAVLYGVASRDLGKAKVFALEYGAAHFFGSYEDLAKDPKVDIIYIATPHVFHFENAMLCLQHGKAVLCEKPMGMNWHQVKTMVDNAQQNKLFLMEALWTRFIPCTEKLLEVINSGIIGEIVSVEADFGFVGNNNPMARVLNKELGGGSLLDVGIYPIFLTLLILGLPDEINANALFTKSKVDGLCNMYFQYGGEKSATLQSSIISHSPIEAKINGTLGSVLMHKRFHHTETLTINRLNWPTDTINIKYVGNGYFHEIVSVMECLQNGEIENIKMPHSMSLNVIAAMDRVRKIIGLEY
jgi:predicted dehydrogenase